VSRKKIGTAALKYPWMRRERQAAPPRESGPVSGLRASGKKQQRAKEKEFI
jgi:hypothetical protein